MVIKIVQMSHCFLMATRNTLATTGTIRTIATTNQIYKNTCSW